METRTYLARLLAAVAMAILLSATLAAAAGLPVARFDANVEKALASERLHRTAEAREFWLRVHRDGEILLSKSPDNTAFLLGTARAHYALGDYRESIRLYERAIGVHERLGVNTPDRLPWVYVYVGLANAQIGDRDKAVEYWKKVPSRIGPVYTAVRREIERLEAAPKAGGY